MPTHHRARKQPLVARRPTEVVSGVGGAAAVYGFLTQAGVPQLPAAIIAVVAGFIPAIVTDIKDLLDSRSAR